MSTQKIIRSHKRRNGQQGLAIVEFTIALPLLMFLLFAGAEVGRLLYQYNTLAKATEDGARYLASQVRIAQSNGTLGSVTSDAEKLVRYGSTLDNQPALLPGTVTITTDTTGASPAQINVTASYAYQPMIFPNSIPGFGLWDDLLLARTVSSSINMPIL